MRESERWSGREEQDSKRILDMKSCLASFFMSSDASTICRREPVWVNRSPLVPLRIRTVERARVPALRGVVDSTSGVRTAIIRRVLGLCGTCVRAVYSQLNRALGDRAVNC